MRDRLAWVALGTILLGGAVYWGWRLWPERVDPQVAKVKALQEKLFTGDSAKGFATPPSKEVAEERRAQFRELRAESEKLTPEQQQQLMKSPPPFMKMFQAEIDTFSALKPAEKRKHLDKRIDEMEAWGKLMRPVAAVASAAKSAVGGGSAAGGGGTPSGGASAAGGKSNDGGPGGPFRGRSSEEVRRMVLNSTTPTQRAQMSEYLREMQVRRAQRGMPQLPMPRF